MIDNPNSACYWRSHIYLVSSCYVYGSVYCALYVRMCEWFFECTMRALVGFRGVGWPVRCRHLSKGTGQSALRKWAYQRTGNWANQWLTRGAQFMLYKFRVLTGIQSTIVTDQVSTKSTAFRTVLPRICCWLHKDHLASPRKCVI